MANCGTDKTNFENYETCRNTDWMYISGSYWWIISPDADSSRAVWNVNDDGSLGHFANTSGDAPRPAAYLKSDITLSGSGTLEDPYKIVS
ncbi:unknown [Firmicutes bacterium CAG:822]|nr:unknown [Firmicutes bacterium CAG:822]